MALISMTLIAWDEGCFSEKQLMACDKSAVVSLNRQDVSHHYCRPKIVSSKCKMITYPSIVEIVSVPKE
jgi:hypothetical protein